MSNSAKREHSIRLLEQNVSTVITLAIFGASTLAIIAGQMADPADIWKPAEPPFHLHQVRTILGAAWFFFFLSLLVAMGTPNFLPVIVTPGSSDEHDGPNDIHVTDHQGANDNQDRLASFVFLVEAVMGAFNLAGFLCLSLVLAAYTGAIGWVAVGVASLIGASVLLQLVLFPFAAKKRMEDPRNGRRDSFWMYTARDGIQVARFAMRHFDPRRERR